MTQRAITLGSAQICGGRNKCQKGAVLQLFFAGRKSTGILHVSRNISESYDLVIPRSFEKMCLKESQTCSRTASWLTPTVNMHQQFQDRRWLRNRFAWFSRNKSCSVKSTCSISILLFVWRKGIGKKHYQASPPGLLSYFSNFLIYSGLL